MKVGVIGLGAMGAPMAMNLHRADLLRALWNRTRSRAQALSRETGVAIAESPAELAAGVDLVLTSVSRDADLEEVINALLPGIRPGSVVADTSTVSADTARAMAAALKPKGAAFLDCPVSGGVEGARNARLAMMAGGEETVLELIRPALATVAATIVYMGPSGFGQATKAVNQIMAAGINQAVTEALAFGESMGLDLTRVIDVVSQGAAANWYLSHRGKTMVAGRFDPGFKVALHHKDLAICRAMGGGRPLPIVDLTLENYQRLIDRGYGAEDISSLYRIKREQLGAG
ncbi:MAG: NAD(P)-dependent oxidoreductase [Pseudomonadota bacterium]|nr:NAD(P)-dependent oxidoreductase [Pseudomonadota bacterium]